MSRFFVPTGFLILILFFIFETTGGQLLPACRDIKLNKITFDIDIGVELTKADGVFYLFADVTWTINNPGGATIDGFAVHFLDTKTKRNHSTEAHSLPPINVCHSGENHLWVNTTERSACDTSDSVPQCSENVEVEGACLCPQPNCTLFYPPPCRSVLELLGEAYDFHLTVLPTTNHLRYLIQLDTEYEFSITPYHSEFANLSPTTLILNPVNECDEDVIKNLSRLADVKVSWSPANVDLFVVEVNQTNGNITINVQSINTTDNDVIIPGLEVCQAYMIAIYGEIQGNLLLISELRGYILTPNLTLATTPPSTTLSTPTADTPTTWTTTVAYTTTVSVTSISPVTHDSCLMIPCDLNAQCVNGQDGMMTCVCDVGYSGNGYVCEEFSICDALGTSCHPNATCHPESEFFVCECNTGLQGDGINCEDIDECENNMDTCQDFAQCNNTFGSFFCECTFGFEDDSTICRNSSSNTSTTWTTTVFSTTTASVTPIPPVTHDSCLIPCALNSQCIRGQDGMMTCVCDVGYSGNGSFCDEFSICDAVETGCHPNATCHPEGEFFVCECNTGLQGDGINCEASSLNCSTTQTIAGFTFPPTQPGLVSYSEEKCRGGTEVSIASIRCVFFPTSITSQFDPSTLIMANCSESFEDLTSPPYEDVSRKLDTLQDMTSQVEDMTETDVQQVTEFLQGISESNQQFSRNDILNVAEITSHLSQYYGQDTVGATASSSEKQSLLQSVDVISRKIEGSQSNFNAASNDINIAVQDITNTESSVTFEARFSSESSPLSPIKIRIPSEALNIAKTQLTQGGMTASSVRVVSVGYRSSNLFPSERKTSWVISSSLGDANSSLERISVAQPVEITNNQIEDQPGEEIIDDFKRKLTKVECVFWDFNQGSWSSDGCLLVPGTPVKCQCNHLTNFAILVSTKEIPANFALSVVTYVGCGLSIICLICTVLFICLARRLLKKHPMQIMMNLCICLAISLAFILFGVDSSVDKTGCAVLTAFLHYFLLATWLWMAIYSHTVYRDVVKVLDSFGRAYSMYAACGVAYGTPLVIVLLNAGITLGHIDRNQPDDPFLESSYVARNFCWLREYSLYFGFLLPVGIMLVYNLVVFCIVIPKITCRKKQVQSSALPKGVKRGLIIAVVLATTMGLSWITGYLMLISDNVTYLTAMSWVFAIINSFQGVFIFVFTVVRTGELQKLFNTKLMNYSTTEERPSSTVSTGLGLSPRSPPKSPAPRL